MHDTRRKVIAALLDAGRPDLANHVAYSAVGYWEQQYRKLMLQTRELRGQVDFWRKQARRDKGSGSLLAKSLDNAIKRLDQFARDIEPLRQGIGEQLSPHEVPRLQNVS